MVYRTEQQRIKYLVEFTVTDDVIQELTGLNNLLMTDMDELDEDSQEISESFKGLDKQIFFSVKL